MRKNSKKKVLMKKKDGERNLHFPSCPPNVQATLRGTRRTEWKKWMNFKAGVILKDEEVRQLTEAGCEIYPMKWRTDSPAGDVDSHNIVCSWCAQAHVSTHACDFTN